jgi:hypothetical protein
MMLSGVVNCTNICFHSNHDLTLTFSLFNFQKLKVFTSNHSDLIMLYMYTCMWLSAHFC